MKNKSGTIVGVSSVAGERGRSTNYYMEPQNQV